MANTSIEVMGKIVELLTPLESEERMRIVAAALTLLGEKGLPVGAKSATAEQDSDEQSASFPPRARTWMKQHGVTTEQVQQVFQVSGDNAEVIAASIPGKSKREQTLSAYILTGAGKLISTGEANFDDKSARALCEAAGCYDSPNHTAILRNKGNEFTGSKDKGWSLTSPGLKRAADMIKEIAK